MSVTEPREGSTADLVRRMDRIESRLDTLEPAVSRMEANQVHADELNKLRFDGLDRAIALYGGKLDSFMSRMEGIMTGEVKTAAARDLEQAMRRGEAEGAKVMAEWTGWREEVDADREAFGTFRTQANTITRIVLLILGSGWLVTALALYRALVS